MPKAKPAAAGGDQSDTQGKGAPVCSGGCVTEACWSWRYLLPPDSGLHVCGGPNGRTHGLGDLYCR